MNFWVCLLAVLFFLHGTMDFAMICVIGMSMFDIYQCYTGIWFN